MNYINVLNNKASHQFRLYTAMFNLLFVLMILVLSSYPAHALTGSGTTRFTGARVETEHVYDFAQRLIKYYGDGRSKIIVTGLRPGEKLYEELLAKEDTTIPTDDKLVFKAKLNDHKLDEDEFIQFYNTINTYTDLQLEEKLKHFVPEFQWQHSKVILEEKEG